MSCDPVSPVTPLSSGVISHVTSPLSEPQSDAVSFSVMSEARPLQAFSMSLCVRDDPSIRLTAVSVRKALGCGEAVKLTEVGAVFQK